MEYLWLLYLAVFGTLLARGIPASRRYLTRRNMIREHKCQPPASVRQRDPILGLDAVFRQFRSYESGQRNTAFIEQVKTYGYTFQSQTYGRRRLFTIQPDNLRAIMSTDFQSWGVEPLRLAPWEPFLGKGVMDTDGAFWKHSRALIQPTFSKEQIADLASYDVHVQRFLDLIPRNGSTVDLQPLFALLALDASTEFLFGTSIECLTTTATVDARAFLKAFTYAQKCIGKRLQLPQWTLYTRDKQFKGACEVVQAFVDRYVEQAILYCKTSSAETGTKYIMAYELAKQTQNKIDIRNQLLNVFLPGHDAIAVLLTNIFFNLARNSTVYLTLRQEVLRLGDQELTITNLRSLPYLQHVIDETFRLNPTVGQNARIALRDTVLPTGGGPSGSAPILVCKGDAVQFNFYALHRRPEIYGDDADKFRPERWEKLRVGHRDYLPFGGGPRVCPAREMSLAQARFVVVRMVQAFKALENRDPVQEFVEVYKISTESKNGAKVMLVPA
ncbi:hypothetical protein MMC17_009833 [Xylographa soralifera]|nr:hypothetical protein [Xylographa soralifera]